MTYFWIEAASGNAKTYDELVEDLNRIDRGRPLVCESDPYRLYVQVLHSLLAGYEIVCLDDGLSEEELARMEISPDQLTESFPVQPLNLGGVEDLLDRVRNHDGNWHVSLYTSGTTGRPKQVRHRLQTLTREAKVSESHRNDVWAFAYHPAHIAGFHVFFQAFLNRNPIVFVFGAEGDQIVRAFTDHGVTHISATPTFYRHLLPYLKEPNVQVRRVTCGGERFDENLADLLVQAFPSARVRNVYASTEAGSLLSSTGQYFSIPEKLKGLIKISDRNELLVHQSLLADFNSAAAIEGEWYLTGDLVEWVNDSQFLLTSRKSEMINVGGYKVNPHEIEAEIRKIDGVKDVVVSAKENRLVGNVLIAQIVKAEHRAEADITSDIYKLPLQSWKIPRVVQYVNELSMTKTGKLVRT